jgi:hypothetical protein
MIFSRPETAKAFEQLIAALDAEAQELNLLGSKVALAGNPKNANKVMKLAGERARFRDHVHRLYQEWQQDAPADLPVVIAPPPEPLESMPPAPEIAGPLLSIGEAAKKVGVSPQRIREWIFAGHLPAKQGPTGKWKVSGPGLITCYRKHA